MTGIHSCYERSQRGRTAFFHPVQPRHGNRSPAVAASVSEWFFVHSLTLAATKAKPKQASGYRTLMRINLCTPKMGHKRIVL